MFIVLLKFSNNKSQASEFMAAHNEWIQRGLDDEIFIMVGSLQPGLGGAILAHTSDLEDLQKRVSNDPFVKQDIVSAEILEITPKLTDKRLNFLLG